jgi:hypothetical protein
LYPSDARPDAVTLNNLDKLRPEVSGDVRSYVENMLAVLGNDALGVVAFGSVTGADYVPGQSDVNLAVLVRNVELPLLDRCAEVVASGFKKRIVAPLFLTRDYIARSLDVFPIEFLDMRETGVLLWGENPVAAVKLGAESLRLECELQLKSNLLRTRQAFLEIGRSKGGLERVLTQSLNSLIPLFRAMLTLRGLELPRAKRDIVGSLCKEFQVPDEPFHEILALRAKGKNLPPGRGPALLSSYLLNVENLAGIVDTLSVGEKT